MTEENKQVAHAPLIAKIDPLEDAVGRLASNLLASLRNALIYSPEHSQFFDALERCEQTSARAFDFVSEVAFICLEREIIFNDRPMNQAGLHFKKLADFMHSLNVQKLTFLPGLSAEELKGFVLCLIGKDEQGEETGKKLVKATKHIRIGSMAQSASMTPKLSQHVIVNLLASGMATEDEIDELRSSGPGSGPGAIAEGETGGGGGGGNVLTSVDVSLLDRAKRVFSSASSSEVGKKVSAKEAMLNFIYFLLKYSNQISIMAPLREHDIITYRHSVNVAILSGAQAKLLPGVSDWYHEVVLAGLFHDIGKIKIPAQVLNKADRLTREEKIMIGRHPADGARILAQHPEIPPLAVTAAYEHHMHYNGEKGYPKSRRCIKPRLTSQIVALADFYDASRTPKPYRPAVDLKTIMERISARKGIQFHPMLVENFPKALNGFERAPKPEKEDADGKD